MVVYDWRTTELHVLVNRGRVYDHCIYILVYTFSVSKQCGCLPEHHSNSVSTCASEALHPCRIFDMLLAAGLALSFGFYVHLKWISSSYSLNHSLNPLCAVWCLRRLKGIILYHNYIGATMIDVFSYMRWGSNSQHCFWKFTGLGIGNEFFVTITLKFKSVKESYLFTAINLMWKEL